MASRDLGALAGEVARRQPPDLPSRYRRHQIVRALFVPDTRRATEAGDVAIVSLRDLMPE